LSTAYRNMNSTNSCAAIYHYKWNSTFIFWLPCLHHIFVMKPVHQQNILGVKNMIISRASKLCLVITRQIVFYIVAIYNLNVPVREKAKGIIRGGTSGILIRSAIVRRLRNFLQSILQRALKIEFKVANAYVVLDADMELSSSLIKWPNSTLSPSYTTKINLGTQRRMIHSSLSMNDKITSLSPAYLTLLKGATSEFTLIYSPL
jgi:hypothetical protein